MRIRLTRGYEAVVDPEDFVRINSFTWTANVGLKGYVRALRMFRRKAIYMHHQVLEIMPWDLDGKVIDHIDGNALNNRKGNLRVVTHQDNMLNMHRHKNRRGYSYSWRASQYAVYLDEPKMKRVYLGYARTRVEAIKKLEEARKKNNPL